MFIGKLLDLISFGKLKNKTLESKNETDPLEYALNNKDIHDFVIKIADKVIYSNKIILYCRSSFFRELLEKDLNQNEITLDIAYELFYPLVSKQNTLYFYPV